MAAPPRPDLNEHRSWRTGNPGYWEWLQKQKAADPVVNLLQRTETARLTIEQWIEAEKKLQADGKVPARPAVEKTDWSWRANMSMKCQFCDLFCTKDAMAKIPHEHGHWSFRPWHDQTYTTACPLCYESLQKTLESKC